MTTTQKVQYIANRVINTHNEQDLLDLYTFNSEEINNIYNDLIESDKQGIKKCDVHSLLLYYRE